ncbi:sigma-54-dependent transcriptional regulator [Candidatus Methylocalor cossyra]|uniref:Two-component system response regulator n=1 Tax=Candidatus Methylocalor cossyra TaxID=3108543 RepID=A0ABM9NJT1_9GAMM
MEPVAALPVLLVDDEPQVLRSASIMLRASGLPRVVTVEDSRAVLPLLETQAMGVMVLDLTMPHLSGHALLERVAADHPDLPVIVMTATNDLETAVQCMQMGAVDYLVKPVEPNRLTASIKRALEIRALGAEVLSLKERLLEDRPHQPEAFAEIITQSKAMFAIFRYIEAIAPSPQPVLITGESGTGKELVARALHRLSGRPGELVAINVAGLDDTVFSDTLFGHVKGAYTGAERTREGLIASAAEGTLFLDEIGDLSMASQVKLLRLLQDGRYYPLGADRPRQGRARVVVATNADVLRGLSAGTFRKDLYFRLRTHHLNLPPLRERRGDLPLLVAHCIDKAARTLGKPAPTAPLALYQLLNTYRFPGNVRELEGLIFDAVARCPGRTLPLQSFKEAMAGELPSAEPLPESPAAPLASVFPDRLPTLDEAEAMLIGEALRRAQANQSIAASLLGISRQALNKRLARRRSSDSAAESRRD